MAFASLRQFLEFLEKQGELRRVKAEVSWNLEAGAISRRALELKGPALLFEKISDYPPDHQLLANLIGASRPTYARLALALGLPKETPASELINFMADRIRQRVKPRVVSTGPCKENIHFGDDVDLLEFPAPFVHGTDGGRYLASWHVNVTRDPDTGWVNWGMYRHMLHDRYTLGWLAVPAQHGGSTFYQKYEARGQPMPMAVAIGVEPASTIVAASPIPAQVNEAEVAGALRGEPIELVKCETIDLEVPASSEIVLEGLVLLGERRLEGDFGEYTGYAAGGRHPRPVFKVQCVTHRNSPILTMSNPGKLYDESSLVCSISYSAFLTNDLKEKGVPFKALYFPAPLLSVVVAAGSLYPGFVHTLASAIASTKAGFYKPYIFVVGEDVDPTNPEEVFWCLTTRLHPSQGIHVTEGISSYPLWPFMSKEERTKGKTSRVVFDATFPAEWPEKEKPTIIDWEHAWPEEMKAKVKARWSEYGLDDL